MYPGRPEGVAVRLTGRSDEALLLACRRGDEAAWAELVNRYQRLIYAIPLRAGLDEEQAADVFQGVFAILIERLDDIREPSRLNAWLVTTAKRETWRVTRRLIAARSTASTTVDPGAAEEMPDDAPLPGEVLARLEEQHAVRTAVDALDGRCQELLRLLFYDPDSPPYTDMAARLGIAVGSIGPIRARCLERLRRQLERAGR
jgi:RNA polymerase sigma factor (sigma-70 family)